MARKEKGSQELIFDGLGVSGGIAIGPVYLRESGEVQFSERNLAKKEVAGEVARLGAALAKAEKQVAKLKTKAEAVHGAASEELGLLLDAHAQMLKSATFLKGIERRIREQQINAEAAVAGEGQEIAAHFRGMDDPYLRTRASEVEEVANRILRCLVDKTMSGFSHLQPNSIIVAEDITPADTALMDPDLVAGFATALGGAESHTAIMARSLGIPAVLGVPDLLGELRSGDTIILDGTGGRVILNPSAKRLGIFERRQKELLRETRALSRLRDVRAVTRDGERIILQANVELPRELAQAVANGAEGVGLLRTEFLFMNRKDLPSEEEQYQALREIMIGLAGRPLTVRTFDLGGDKLAEALGAHFADVANPALGLRAIRLSLMERPLLEAQLAAALRAAAHGPVRILLPMISTVSEVLEVRKVLASVAKKLKRRKVKLPKEMPPVGVMIEVPGAALAADSLARVSDFFALGTNDLTMYTLAIDRGEERVAHLYNPLHPAVLRLIQFTVEAALRARIPVSVCGEIAGDPRYTPLLLGLGVRELSMSSNSLLRVKNRVLGLDLQAATRRAAAIMDQTDQGRIAALLEDFSDAG